MVDRQEKPLVLYGSYCAPGAFLITKIMSKITDYITETRGELKRVSWPTKSQAAGYTVLVILISVFVALFLGLFDYIFTLGLKGIVG